MTKIRIAPIVEGHGECEAVPVLIRRIAKTIDPAFVPTVLHPIRIPATRIWRENCKDFENSMVLAGRKLGGLGGIVVIVDSDQDDSCPATDGPRLLDRARSARDDVPIVVILAKREFEAWFLAAAASLRGKRGLPLDLNPPPDPEAIRGAKEWLSNQMPEGRIYTETDDQAALTAVFDLDAARCADSFDKCFRDIDHMLRTLRRLEA